jgi:excisionase family DNA binding protein
MDARAELLTIGEVAELFRVHQSTIYRLVKKGLLPGFKVGNDWRFSREAIDQWRLHERHLPPANQTQSGTRYHPTRDHDQHRSGPSAYRQQDSMISQLKDMRSMSIRAAIVAQFEQIAKEKELSLPPLDNDLLLLDSGVDSLCVAIIVARLEDELGVDPFSGDDHAEIPVTFANLVSLYETAVSRALVPK